MALGAYSYFSPGPADADVRVALRLPKEETKIQNLLAQRGTHAEVNVLRAEEGRRVEIILAGGAADSLASMDITSPPTAATTRAKDLVRILKTSYDAFDTLVRVEVGFAKRLTVDDVGIGQSARIIFGEDDLRALEN